jgi:hypothetical protein
VKSLANNPYLFIVGCARSGTTLLQRMLDHHPLVAVANEARFMLRITENGAEGGDLPLTQDSVEWVRNHHRFAKLGLPDGTLDKAAAVASTYTELVRALYGEFGKLHGKVLAGEKTPRYVRYLPLLHNLFPWVKTLHLIRDGRDVALSTLQWAANGDKGPGRFQLWSKQPVAACALWWKWQVSAGRLDGSVLPRERYHEVKYEELVSQPDKTLRQVTEFLDLPFAAEMFSYNEGKVQHGIGLSSKKAWLAPTPGLRDWRTEMVERDLELFEAMAGDLLTTLGYERVFKAISPEIAKAAEQYRNCWETEMAARAKY